MIEHLIAASFSNMKCYTTETAAEMLNLCEETLRVRVLIDADPPGPA